VDVLAATAGYEAWLAGFCPLHAPDLAHKHARMADPAEPFPFFRGTYYRWASLWPAACPGLAEAPRVLAVGDLHVENFGTWRDADGRLCWGVNDFDEADRLPYTNDLVRLAASARLARAAGALDVKTADACRAILEGYRDALAAGGTPFVLEESHPELRGMALAAERDPARFWAKLTKLLDGPAAEPPADARAALTRDLPADGLAPAFRFRAQAGMGSLGRPRFVALAEWRGGRVCREAKALAPPATAWAAGGAGESKLAEAARAAVRPPDPFYRADGAWVVRRLAPHCSRIGLDALGKADARRLLAAMGAEVANVHLGTPGAGAKVLKDLARRKDGWLEAAARAATEATEKDRAAWRAARAATSAEAAED
jgi:hypothetical protein